MLPVDPKFLAFWDGAPDRPPPFKNCAISFRIVLFSSILSQSKTLGSGCFCWCMISCSISA